MTRLFLCCAPVWAAAEKGEPSVDSPRELPHCFTMPVRKGEQYLVGSAGNGGSYTITASFMPLGR